MRDLVLPRPNHSLIEVPVVLWIYVTFIYFIGIHVLIWQNEKMTEDPDIKEYVFD